MLRRRLRGRRDVGSRAWGEWGPFARRACRRVGRSSRWWVGNRDSGRDIGRVLAAFLLVALTSWHCLVILGSGLGSGLAVFLVSPSQGCAMSQPQGQRFCRLHGGRANR